MLTIIKRNPMAAVIAVLMHVAIIIFMIVGVDWLEKPKQPRSDVQVVQARVVDQSRIAAEIERLKQAEAKKAEERLREERQLQTLKQKQLEEKKRLEELQQKRKAEEQRRKRLETERKAEEKQFKAAEAKRKKAEAKQKVEAARRKKAEARRVEQEKKRKAEAAREKAEIAKKKQAEAKREAAEKKRKAAEAERRRQADAKRQAETARKAREAGLQAAARAEQEGREIDRYTTLIKQKVVRNWLRPAGNSEGLKCRLQVRLGMGGAVIAVNVLESSGNAAFDRSAAAAVYKADPLPVPSGGLFEQFRDINFWFKPNR
jgi:colicin import membrane protein